MRQSKKRERSHLNSSRNQPPLTRRLLDRLNPQNRPLLERLGPQNRSLQERLNQPSQPLSERLDPFPPSQPIFRNLEPGPQPSWHKTSMPARKMSLFERMTVRPLSRSSSPLPPNIGIGGSLKRQLSQELSPSSSSSHSPSSKRIRLLSSTPLFWPDVEATRNTRHLHHIFPRGHQCDGCWPPGQNRTNRVLVPAKLAQTCRVHRTSSWPFGLFSLWVDM
jgi:hypothetical protein